MGEGKEHGDIHVKTDLRVGEAAAAESIVVKKVVQKPSIFNGINDGPLSVHLLQALRHVLRKLHMFEKSVKYPVDKKTRLVIKYAWVMGFFL